MRRVLPFAPLDLVDLLLDLQRLEVVEFGLMGLELGVELVLAILFLQGGPGRSARRNHSDHARRSERVVNPAAGTHHLIALEQDDTAPLVTSGKVVARRVELDGRDDIGYMTEGMGR